MSHQASDPQNMAASEGRVRTVLVICSCWWSFPAHTAMAFIEAGWSVEAVCWFQQPLRFVRSVRRVHYYSPIRPLTALSKAIDRARPDLIVPCDDRAVAQLRTLHHQFLAAGHHAAADLISFSMGDPRSAEGAIHRAGLIAVARQEQVLAPETIILRDKEDLRRAVAAVGLPMMLKQDDSWGGIGVRRVETIAQAEQDFEALSRPVGLFRMLKRLLVDRDPFVLSSWISRTVPTVNAQGFVDGKPANCLAACWRGEVIAILGAEVLRTSSEVGPATVVHITNHLDMEIAAKRIVSRLGASGFIGFDFVVDHETGAFHLIEMNQRMTPIGHLAMGAGDDPITAITARCRNTPESARTRTTPGDVVALFPSAWLADPGNPVLTTAHHDVPWSEPELVRELMRLPWHERGILSRLYQWLRGRAGFSSGG